MKKLCIRLQKHKHAIAGAIVLIGVAVTPLLRHLAYLERGYRAIGGEYAPLIMSLVMAAIVLDALKNKRNPI